jgi:hypothetical protein
MYSSTPNIDENAYYYLNGKILTFGRISIKRTNLSLKCKKSAPNGTDGVFGMAEDF